MLNLQVVIFYKMLKNILFLHNPYRIKFIEEMYLLCYAYISYIMLHGAKICWGFGFIVKSYSAVIPVQH